MADFWFREARAVPQRGTSPGGTAWPGWVGATIKVLLVQTQLTEVTHGNLDNLAAIATALGVTPFEWAGAGYTGGHAGVGRRTLSGKSLVLNSNGSVQLACANPTWAGLGTGSGTLCRGAVIFWELGAENLSVPLQFRDSGGFEAGFNFNNSNFTINFPVSGFGVIA